MAGFAAGCLLDQLFRKDDGDNSEERRQECGIDADNEMARNRFLFSLLVLSSHVIMADGKIMHSEMEYVRRFLRQSFGERAVGQGEDILKRLFDYRKEKGETAWQEQIMSACRELEMTMPEEHRLQLVAYLAQIAKADGRVAKEEVECLRELAAGMGMGETVVDQMFSLGGTSVEDAYKVLGVTKDASDDEVRRAYKRLALQYHPDRVEKLGDDVKAAATKKFQKLNEAKEIVFKSRGMG